MAVVTVTKREPAAGVHLDFDEHIKRYLRIERPGELDKWAEVDDDEPIEILEEVIKYD